MSDYKKSVKFTLVVINISIILLFALAVTLPWMVTWFVEVRHKNAGLPAPVFENSRGTFTVTLYKNSDYVKNSMSTEESLLEFCDIPRTRIEIANFLGISTPTYAISKYIKPLIESGKIEMTNSERPNSPNQKYFTKA